VTLPTVALYTGTPRYIGDEGQFSAIWKQPVSAPVRVGRDGLAGDAQADRRVHGGPEKAVHHYASENYAALAARFPQLADTLVAGSIGENIATTGVDETMVCIGDIVRIGSVVLQVCQPRRPCWKIDARYGVAGITAHIVATGLTGWYYRVLEEGVMAPGDAFEPLERPAGAVPLATLWTAWHHHRPAAERLAELAAAPGLTPAWVKKLHDRIAWLAAHGEATAPTPGTSGEPPVKG